MDEREAQIALFKKRKKIANISFLVIMIILVIFFVLYEWRRLSDLSENNSTATESSSLGTVIYEKNPKPKGVSAELSQSFGELLEKIGAINWTTDSIIASSTATTTIATTTATTTNKK